MAGIAKDAMLQRTMHQMRKSDPELTGILLRATVVFVAVWEPDETATEEQRKAGKGAWVELGEGPLFICTRASAPHYQIVIKPRAQQKKNILVDMTDKFTFTNKKPNLQVVETDEKGLFNFHFPSNEEGEEGFEKAVSLMQRICDGDTGPDRLTPLVSIPAADLAKLQPQHAQQAAPASRAVDVGALFAQPPPKQAQAPPTLAQTQDSAFAATQDVDPARGQQQGAGAAPEATAAAAHIPPADTLRPTASVPQPPPANGPHALLPSGSGNLPSTQQITHMQGGFQPRPPPLPPRPPPEARDPPASSIMQSLFSGSKPEKPAARGGAGRTSQATASPSKATKAAVPAVNTLAADHASQPTGKNSTDVGAKGAAFPSALAAAQQNSQASAAKPDGQAGAKATQAGANSPGKAVAQRNVSAVDSGATAAVVARRAATRKVLDVLLQDDRFLDAVSDALDAVGLRQTPL